MKPRSILAAVLTCVLALPALADDAPMVPLDLSTASADFALTMPAPKDAVAKDDFGDVKVTAGDGFQVIVHPSESDLVQFKKDITENTMNKLKRFTTDTKTALVYESEVMGKSEYHFVLNVKVGEKTYGVEDNKGPSYSEDQVNVMVKSAQGLAAK